MCGPLFLPICVSQNRLPFLGGEGWEVVLGLVLDFIEEQKVVVIIDALVRGLTTPEQVDWRKRKVARRPMGSEIEMADVIYGLSPDSLYPWEPIWHCPGISEASKLLIIHLGEQKGRICLGPFGLATGYAWVISPNHGRCRMGSPSSLILFSLFSSLRFTSFVRLKGSKHSV